MKSQGLWRAAAVGLLVVGGVLAGRAMATGVPTVSPLTFSGLVTDDAGKPYAKAVPVIVTFYAGQTATTPACTAASTQAEAGSGRFEVALAADCADAVHASKDLWSELTVGDGKVALPRSRVGAVPYALEAQVASQAGGVLAGELAASGKAIAAVEADIAAVKKAVPMLVDAKGQVVGRALGPSVGSEETALTSTGYLVLVDWLTGKQGTLVGGKTAYLSADCTGTHYYPQYASAAYGRTRQLRATWSESTFVYIDEIKIATADVEFKSHFVWSSNQCIPETYTTKAGATYGIVKVLTLAEAGLTAPIVGPLTIQ